jgi:hypothetical protein
MKTWMLGLFLAALVAPAGSAADLLLSFRGGIGVDPVSGVTGTAPALVPALNVVRGTQPGGAPWRIGSLRADIENGHIKVVGRGLLLAGTNNIGTPAGQSVRPLLSCVAANGTLTSHTTAAAVALASNGDFRIDDTLTSVPASCGSPVLLIVNAGGRWFAAGILASDDDDD